MTWQHALTESPSAHLTDAVVDRCHHTGDLIAATRYQSAWFAHRVDAAGNDDASRLLDLLSCCSSSQPRPTSSPAATEIKLAAMTSSMTKGRVACLKLSFCLPSASALLESRVLSSPSASAPLVIAVSWHAACHRGLLSCCLSSRALLPLPLCLSSRPLVMLLVIAASSYIDLLSWL